MTDKNQLPKTANERASEPERSEGSLERGGCAAPSELQKAINRNLHECRKMSGSKDVAVSAMGTFGLSMMEEMQRLLPKHEAQHNVSSSPTRLETAP